MISEYLQTIQDVRKAVKKAENNLLNSTKQKFQMSNDWRKQAVPNSPGVYALFENRDTLLYLGETGNLREGMSDICRTVNHTFRKQLARKRFGIDKSIKKFDENTELLLDTFFNDSLFVNFIEVNFGRTEIEEHLVTKYQNQLLNSEKKRKLKIQLDEMED